VNSKHQTTLRRVDVARRGLADYRELAPAALLDELVALGRTLDGARILQVNATGYGGGVAELLSSELALMRNVGVDVEWRLICPDGEFFAVTKRIHNAMQGEAVELTHDELAAYVSHNRHCASMLGDGWDVVVVHDPQPALLITAENATDACFVWRCHIDTSRPEPSTWDLLRPFVCGYDAAVFTLPAFVPRDLSREQVAIIAPAIDPLSTKNRTLPRHLGRRIVADFGLDLTRPLIVQVSRFDRWKDPLGVLDAWREARERVPELQLAFVGAMADDDPEAWAIYEQLAEAARHEPDCHLLTNLDGVGPLEVNAFQREADVVVQKSLREGFGLTVSEALWKETPVVGGNAGGIPLQIGEDEGGILVRNRAECVEAIVTLLEDEELAAAKARAGRERVRREFLMPRLVRDDLALYARLLQTPARTARQLQALAR